MKRSSLFPALLTAASFTAFAAGGLWSLGDDIAQVVGAGPAPGGSGQLCGAYCNGQLRLAGFCPTSDKCCGWYNCSTDEYKKVCCPPSTICSPGTHVFPPADPKCLPAAQ